MTTVAGSRERPAQQGKGIEEVVTYAISNRTRVELLIILCQGAYCASELSEIIGKPINTVSNHLKALEITGAIEIAETKQSSRNLLQHFYRAIKPPEYSKTDLKKMHPYERQVQIGLIVQALLAEILASLWAGKLRDDPGHCFYWDRLNLDEEGRGLALKEQERHVARLAEIEKKSLLRSARTGKGTVPYIIAALGFVRGRKAPVAP